MRHRVAKKKLNRTKGHRDALLVNLATSLIEKESINTTLVKTKFVKPYVEKLITKAKKAKMGDKVVVFNILKDLKAKTSTERAAEKLIKVLGPRFEERKGGYTRIIKTGFRNGDQAPTARIELIGARVEKKAGLKEEKEALKAKTKKNIEKKDVISAKKSLGPAEKILKERTEMSKDKNPMIASGER